MTAQEIADHVRTLLTTTPLSGEHTGSEDEIITSPRVEFSDPDLLERIGTAVATCSSVVKASDVHGLVDTSTGTGQPGFISVSHLRVLTGRVLRKNSSTGNFVLCLPRGLEQHRRMSSGSGFQASEEYPVFTLASRELNIYPAPGDYKFAYVKEPSIPSSLSNTLDLDERFEGALVYHVLASCHESLQNPERSNAWLSEYIQQVQPMARATRINTFNDDEVTVE